MKKQRNHPTRLSLLPHTVFYFLLPALFALGAASSSGGRNISPITTMDELSLTEGTAGQVVRLLGYHQPGDPGGGLFVWNHESETEPNTGTVIAVEDTAVGRWKRMADDVKVTYFGARGDGENDDTAAIQAAIDSVSSTTSPGVVGEADRKVGGTVHFPAGKYRISDTLLVGPHTTLTGVGSPRGWQRRGVNKHDHGSVIMARFEDPEKWMISTAIYRRGGDADGQPLGHREISSGRAYDNVTVSRADGVQIRDLLLTGEKNANDDPPYGGIRLQNSPGAVLQGVGVFQVDVAYLINSGWGISVRDCFSVSHLYGLLAFWDVNGLHIDSCIFDGYSRSEREIDDSNILIARLGSDPQWLGRQASMPADYPYKKMGILTHYGHNVTLNNVITEHWDIARFHKNGNISDTGSWLEGNRELCYALIAVNFNLQTPFIHAPRMVEEGRFMRAGSGARVTINQSKPFPITYGAWEGRTDNRISVNVPDPDRQGWKHYPLAVTYVNRRPGHVRVAGDEDEAVDNTRIADTSSYVDLTTALQRIAVSNHRDWTIELKEGAICVLSEPVELADKQVTLVRPGEGERPLIQFRPDADGRAGLLRFGDGGGLTMKGVDLKVDNPEGALDPEHRGLISIEGGRFELELSDTAVSLADTQNDPEQAFSMLRTTGRAAIVEAILSNVDIDSGHALFEDGEGLKSDFSSRIVNTRMPSDMPERKAAAQ